MTTHVIGVRISCVPFLHLLPAQIVLPEFSYDLEHAVGDRRLREARFGVVDHALRLPEIHGDAIVLVLVACVMTGVAAILVEGVVEILPPGEEG